MDSVAAEQGTPSIAPKLPTSIKKLNKQLATRQNIELPEEELEEKFVRGKTQGCGRFVGEVVSYLYLLIRTTGSGPGGQAINKTSNAVGPFALML
jgi:hypothetical protein